VSTTSTPVPRGTNQHPLLVLNTSPIIYAGTEAASTAYGHMVGLPDTEIGDGSTQGYTVHQLDKSDMCDLAFALSDASPSGKTATVKLWGLKPIDAVGLKKSAMEAGATKEYQAFYLGKLTLTAGAATPASGSQTWPAGAGLVNTIVVTEDKTLSPGIRVTNETGALAVAQFDHGGAVALLVAGKIGTCTGIHIAKSEK
jgi:hypothetical protein